MTYNEIITVFENENIPVPGTDILELPHSNRTLDIDGYDDQQSWCCGYDAQPYNDGIILQEYCKRGRGTDKPVYFIDSSGNAELITTVNPEIFNGPIPVEKLPQIDTTKSEHETKKRQEKSTLPTLQDEITDPEVKEDLLMEKYNQPKQTGMGKRRSSTLPFIHITSLKDLNSSS